MRFEQLGLDISVNKWNDMREVHRVRAANYLSCHNCKYFADCRQNTLVFERLQELIYKKGASLELWKI